MGTSPYSSAGYISRSQAPYNGLDYDFRVRSGAIAGAGKGSLAHRQTPAQHGQKMP
jgi:hypothetical protein